MVNDIQFSALGLLFLLLNLFSAIADRLMQVTGCHPHDPTPPPPPPHLPHHPLVQRRLLAVTPVDISKNGLVLINNGLAEIPTLALLFIVGEHQSWGKSFGHYGVGDVVLLLLSCVVGTVISWAGLNAQMYISATTMLVVTNLNKFVVIAFGILFLGESRTWQAVLGCCAALGGGVWYAVARKNLAAKRAEATGDAEAGKK